MNIQDLPIEVFKVLLQHVAFSLDLRGALQLRLVSKLFANEMIEAAIASGVMDEITNDSRARWVGVVGEQLRIVRCPDEGLQAKYLRSRVQKQRLAVDEDEDSSEFIDHLKSIVTDFVTKSGGRYDHDISLRTLCDVVIQNFDISFGFANHYIYHSPSTKNYSPDQACLSMACALGDLDLVSTLLKDDNVKINPAAPRHFLSYPIRAAARNGRVNVVDFLLQHGSGIEAEEDPRERDNWTIIHDSILNRDPAMLAFLLDKRLVFPVREKYAGQRRGSAYEDALITAAYNDSLVAFNMLIEKGPVKAPFPLSFQQLLLKAACEGRSTSIARSVFDMHPSLDPNYNIQASYSDRYSVHFTERRNSPLASAAHWGSIEIIQLLISRGADPNWPDITYERALHEAEVQGYDRCVDLLLSAGADPDLLDRNEDETS